MWSSSPDNDFKSLPDKVDLVVKSLGSDISPFGQIGRYSVRKEFDGASIFVTGAHLSEPAGSEGRARLGA